MHRVQSVLRAASIYPAPKLGDTAEEDAERTEAREESCGVLCSRCTVAAALMKTVGTGMKPAQDGAHQRSVTAGEGAVEVAPLPRTHWW